MSEGSRWVSAHLYFHGDLDDVVEHVVTPAVRAMSGQWFFLRYWEGGPHVRLRVRAAGLDTPAVQHLIRRHAEDYFARNASAARVDAETYQATRRWAMSLEPGTNPAAELSPNNSVRFAPYRREHHKYGYGLAMAAVEQHFMESSDIARDAVSARMPAAERDLLALCALVAGWTVCCPDTDRLRSWIRAGGPRFGPIRSAAADSYRAWPVARQDAVRALVRHTMEGSGAGEATLRQRWVRSVSTLHGQLGRAVAGADRTSVIDNCGHLLCNRLGLSLRREAAVRSLACRAILDTADRR